MWEGAGNRVKREKKVESSEYDRERKGVLFSVAMAT